MWRWLKGIIALIKLKRYFIGHERRRKFSTKRISRFSYSRICSFSTWMA
jgi:hypothetical protein